MNHDTEIFLERVDAKYQNGDTDGALADLDEAIRIDSQNAYYYRDRGLIKYGIDHHTEAILDFTFFLDHTSDMDEKEEIYWKRAISREHLHQYREQISDLKWLIDNDFDEDGYFFDWRCQSKREAGLFGEAVRDFAAAINQRESNNLRLGRAETYLKMGNFEDAYQDLEHVKDAHVNQLIELARFYYQIGAYRGAIKNYTILIEDPSSQNLGSYAYGQRGKCLYRMNKLEDALADFNQMQLLGGEKAFMDIHQAIEYMQSRYTDF
jgi:tetratricopeptide (TPR) repeat protein